MIRVDIVANAIACEDFHWLLAVARDDDTIVGNCNLSGWKSQHPRLDSLHVQPSHRRRGVATALIEACVACARADGKQGVTLIVAKDNSEATALYRKLGFFSWEDTDKQVWMSLPLNENAAAGKTR